MQAKHSYYIRHINKVLDYIDKNLDQSFSLEELSLQANFSKFHFHRIFLAVIGEPPFQYILRLRLEKAASIISSQPHKSLSEIAFQCGFSHPSIFSRNFKKYFHCTPSSFQQNAIQKSNKRQMESNMPTFSYTTKPYFCPNSKTIKWTSNMDIIKNIDVKRLANITVAYNRNLGPYKGNNLLYQQHRAELFAWAASKELMNYENFKYLILYHDNPNVALNEHQKMSLCVTIPPSTTTNGTIGKMDIEAGKYAIFQCELSAPDFPTVWNWIYEQWFPNNHYIPDTKPYFECYPEQPSGAVFKVDFCIPVKVAEKP